MAFRRIERSIAVAVILLFSMILNYARSENAFDHVYAPYSGFRIVEKDGKQGLIDGSGQTIIPCEYDALSFADFGTIRVVKNNAWGLFDLDGNVLLHPVYNYISQHVDAVDSIWFGYAVYMDTEKMGYLYFDHVLTDMIYDRLAISDPFPEDYNNVVFKDVHGANQYSDPGIGRYINALLPNDIVFETGSGQWTVDDITGCEAPFSELPIDDFLSAVTNIYQSTNWYRLDGNEKIPLTALDLLEAYPYFRGGICRIDYNPPNSINSMIIYVNPYGEILQMLPMQRTYAFRIWDMQW